MKTTIIPATGIAPDQPAVITQGLRASYPDGLQPAALPSVVCDLPVTPLARYHEWLIVAFGCEIGIVSDSRFVPLGSLDAPATCAVCTPAGITVMTSLGPWVLRRRDNSWHLGRPGRNLPGVPMSLREVGSLSAVISPTTLSAAPDRDGNLAERDIRTLRSKALQAWQSVLAQAHADNLVLGPVLGGWFARDSDGCIVRHGYPRMLTVNGGAGQSVCAVGSLGADKMSVNAMTLSVRAFTVDVDLPDDLPQDISLTTYTCPAPDIVDPGISPLIRVQQPASAAPSISIHFQSASGECDSEISIPDYTPPFAASCVAVSGDTVVWGDLTLLRPQGYDIRDICAETGVGSWKGVMQVTFADGSKACHLSGGNNKVPTALSPVITYPDSDARQLDIWVERFEGSVYHASVQLHPLGNLAASRATDSRPVPLTLSGDPSSVFLSSPSESGLLGRRLAGTIAAAPLASPVSLFASASVSASPISALAPAPRVGSVWSAACARLYAWSESGCFSVAVTAGKTRTIRACSLDNVGIPQSPARHLIASGSDSVAALTSAALRIYSGARSRAAPVRLPPFSSARPSIAYHPIRDEWIIADADDHSSALTVIDSRYRTYSSTLSAPCSSLFTVGDTVLALTDTALLDICAASGHNRPVMWVAQVDASSLPGIGVMRIHAAASALDIRLTVSAVGISPGCPPLILADMSVTGALQSSLPVLWRMPDGFDLIRIELSGNVSPDFHLRHITFSTR